MKDLLPDIDRWKAQGKRVALARVVGLERRLGDFHQLPTQQINLNRIHIKNDTSNLIETPLGPCFIPDASPAAGSGRRDRHFRCGGSAGHRRRHDRQRHLQAGQHVAPARPGSFGCGASGVTPTVIHLCSGIEARIDCSSVSSAA